ATSRVGPEPSPSSSRTRRSGRTSRPAGSRALTTSSRGAWWRGDTWSSSNRWQAARADREPSGASLREVRVGVAKPLRVLFPGERARACEPGLAGWRAVRLVKRRGDHGRPGGNVAHGSVEHRVSPDFAQRRKIAGHHHGSACQGFEDGETEPFGLARDEHDRRAATQPGEHGTVELGRLQKGVAYREPVDLSAPPPTAWRVSSSTAMPSKPSPSWSPTPDTTSSSGRSLC